MRFTEYHCGTAVIKDKTKIQAAMHKLALYEDVEENNSRIQDTLAELRTHRDAYMKNSTSWRVINRALNLLIGLNAEVEVLRKKEDHILEDAKKVVTNADRIRNMSDEELVAFIQYPCNFMYPEKKRCKFLCDECIEEWLKAKVE